MKTSKCLYDEIQEWEKKHPGVKYYWGGKAYSLNRCNISRTVKKIVKKGCI